VLDLQFLLPYYNPKGDGVCDETKPKEGGEDAPVCWRAAFDSDNRCATFAAEKKVQKDQGDQNSKVDGLLAPLTVPFLSVHDFLELIELCVVLG